MNEKKEIVKTPQQESSDDVPEAPQPSEGNEENEDDFPAEEFDD